MSSPYSATTLRLFNFDSNICLNVSHPILVRITCTIGYTLKIISIVKKGRLVRPHS